jgi:putative endonuclease
MYFVYLLETNKGSIYTGSTPSLKQRLKEHQSGFCLSTKKLRPLKLIWFSAFPDRLSARQFEKYLKTGSGQAFRNRRLIK